MVTEHALKEARQAALRCLHLADTFASNFCGGDNLPAVIAAVTALETQCPRARQLIQPVVEEILIAGPVWTSPDSAECAHLRAVAVAERQLHWLANVADLTPEWYERARWGQAPYFNFAEIRQGVDSEWGAVVRACRAQAEGSKSESEVKVLLELAGDNEKLRTFILDVKEADPVKLNKLKIARGITEEPKGSEPKAKSLVSRYNELRRKLPQTGKVKVK